MPARHSPHFLCSTSLLVLCLLTSLAVSQEKPKLKDFGSSLKKLKWDLSQNAAVERKSNSKAARNSTSDAIFNTSNHSAAHSRSNILQRRRGKLLGPAGSGAL